MEKNAGEIMSKRLITVKMVDSVRTAYQIMKERNIRHLPVIDPTGDIIGILSDRDLQRAMTPKPEGARNFDNSPEFDSKFLAQDFMAWPVNTVSKDTPIETVARRMLSEKISAFLIKDSHGLPTGIVTTDDLLKVLIALLEKEPDRPKLSLESVFNGLSFSPGNWG